MNDATDPAAALAGWAPSLRPPVLAASDVSYVVEDTVIGRMLLARKDSGAMVATAFIGTNEDEDAVLARLASKVSPRILRQPRELDEARRQLDDYLAGRTRGFTLHTDLALASDFQRIVLPALAASVGYGTRATYGELAARVERPKAARAVGAALGANPLCVVLPCHRVVASSGALTGYAGGLTAKRFLLDLEAGRQTS
ncbi:methylated-DNA--[protein]-cysteine S-methyltransferase [Pedococcus sp. KACC 23699]|uniref:methylated-DNA--[protein]-cysteine S-methyltransferase n=1 Tax=Pedococcus sp. KACC 23699 TaxID=3149228 RepID=A0AAU7JYU6_9MICO